MSKLKSNDAIAILFHPKKTIKKIVETNPKKGFYLLASLSIFLSFVFSFKEFVISPWYYTLLGLIFAAIVSPVIGVIGYYLQGFLYYVTGKILKGKAPAVNIRAVMAWASIPTIYAYSLAIVIFLFLFIISGNLAYALNPYFIIFQTLLLFIGPVWSMVINFAGIMQVQKFSLLRAIANAILAVLFAVLLVLGIGIVVAIFVALLKLAIHLIR